MTAYAYPSALAPPRASWQDRALWLCPLWRRLLRQACACRRGRLWVNLALLAMWANGRRLFIGQDGTSNPCAVSAPVNSIIGARGIKACKRFAIAHNYMARIGIVLKNNRLDSAYTSKIMHDHFISPIVACAKTGAQGRYAGQSGIGGCHRGWLADTHLATSRRGLALWKLQ